MQSQGLIISWPLEPECQADKTGGLNSLVLSASECEALTLHMKCTFSWHSLSLPTEVCNWIYWKQFWATDQRSKVRIRLSSAFLQADANDGVRNTKESAICLIQPFLGHTSCTCYIPYHLCFLRRTMPGRGGANKRVVLVPPLPKH